MDKLEVGKFYLVNYNNDEYWAFVLQFIDYEVLFLSYKGGRGWVVSRWNKNNFLTVVEVEKFTDLIPLWEMNKLQRRLVIRSILDK